MSARTSAREKRRKAKSDKRPLFRVALFGIGPEYSRMFEIVCRHARHINDPSDTEAREFFETWFVPHRVIGKRGKREGLITGYYEPLLFGSKDRNSRHRWPIYRKPPDLLDIRLDSVYPELKDKRLRGRLIGDTVVPYFSRAELDGARSPLAGHEILWVRIFGLGGTMFQR